MDSSVLLHLLCHSAIPSIKQRLHLLHVNYHLRDESDEDELWIQALTERLRINLTLKSAHLQDTNEASPETFQIGNIQGQARKIRYRYAKEIMAEKQIEYLITGHHFDDALENFYMKQLKGQSTKSMQNLFSIYDSPTLVKNHLKPLLPFTKESLLEYAKKNEITYREDKSNSQNKYERNYLRNIIFPKLERKFPAWKRNNHRFQQSISIQTQIVERLIKKNKIIITDSPLIKFDQEFHTYSSLEQGWLFHFYLNQTYPEERFSEKAILDYLKKLALTSSSGVLFHSKKWGDVLYSHGLLAPLKALSSKQSNIKKLLNTIIVEPPQDIKKNHEVISDWQTITSLDLKFKMQGHHKNLKSILSEYHTPIIARKMGFILKSSTEKIPEVIAFLNPLLAFEKILSDQERKKSGIINYSRYNITLKKEI